MTPPSPWETLTDYSRDKVREALSTLALMGAEPWPDCLAEVADLAPTPSAGTSSTTLRGGRNEADCVGG